jgi:hypothetical protein
VFEVEQGRQVTHLGQIRQRVRFCACSACDFQAHVRRCWQSVLVPSLRQPKVTQRPAFGGRAVFPKKQGGVCQQKSPIGSHVLADERTLFLQSGSCQTVVGNDQVNGVGTIRAAKDIQLEKHRLHG